MNYFKTPITSLLEAHAYLRRLHDDHLLYHPDDDAESIVDGFGLRLFKPDEVEDLNDRMEEVRSFDPDPCAFILDVLK